MTSKTLLAEIEKLPLEERIELVELVWDGIAATPEAVPVPEWHRAELDRRLDSPASEPGLTWDEVQRRLRERG